MVYSTPTQIVSVWESYAHEYVDSCVENASKHAAVACVNGYTAG